MSGASLGQPDVSLGLDDHGVIRNASLSRSMPDEVVDSWIGRSWPEVVGEGGADSVRRMIADARSSGVSAFRHVVQRFPSGRELPMEFTMFRAVGKPGGMIALGKSVQGVSELQSRLMAAQQATEREYWKLRDVETRYRLLFDASPEPVLMIGGEDLRILEANPAAVRALGLAPGWEFPGNLSWTEREAFTAMLRRVREQGRVPGIVLHLGSDRAPWAVRASLMADEPGPRYLLHVAPAGPRPVQAAAAPSAGSPAPIAALMEGMPDGFVVLDAGGGVLHANEAFLGLVGAGTAGAVREKPLSRWMSEPGADAGVLLDLVARHRTARLFQTTLVGELGSRTQVEVSACQQRDGHQVVTGLVLRDISRRVAPAELPASDAGTSMVDAAVAQLGEVPLLQAVKTAADMVEREMIRVALDRVDGNRTAAAELLGLSRQSLHSKLNRHSDAPGIGDATDGGE